jgi:hypothetical protein
MKMRRYAVIASLVVAAILITSGVVVALGVGAVNQGTDSTAEGDFSTVSGGRNNNIPDTADFATISGGENNTADGEYSTVGGGSGNIAGADGATVGGGANNDASGGSNTIGGGENNRNVGFNATIGGGANNFAGGEVGSTIGGGLHNRAGLGEAFAFAATVGGGEDNNASHSNSTVGGGLSNTASDSYATVGGGSSNTASGHASTIPGGDRNTAGGDYSFAAGRNAQANHNGTFVWADSTGEDLGEDFASTGENQFLIRASGGVGIGTNSPNQLLVVGDDLGGPLPGNRVTIGNNGTSGPEGRSGLNLGEDQNQRAFILWHNDENYLQLGVKNGNIQENDALVIKDRRVGVGTASPTERLHVNGNVRANQFLTPSSIPLKTNIQTIEGALEKVQALQGVSYDWKADGKHDIGLIAEEVGKVIPEIVVYEENGKGATAVDYARLVPVLIEGMKEQQQLLEDKDSQITALKQEKDSQVAALEARIAALEEDRSLQTGLFPFSASIMWILAGNLGMLLVTPGLMLGYRRIRRYV